ncbi:uncharacterized protein BX664DRAFT_314326 [Halteromyces radiatus]|uniref:uncharacterized protein n=1 Tax=Halteromyces radiatus TaxID=101107 RepID=UPI00221EA114|nr:uncharacterized protein BX664DRAFT_314326 [Halteromyces radiatus]KAI8089094.1 hypothetical protein BX664DRAFT_314326 [Halteromyces radiatus]
MINITVNNIAFGAAWFSHTMYVLITGLADRYRQALSFFRWTLMNTIQANFAPTVVQKTLEKLRHAKTYGCTVCLNANLAAQYGNAMSMPVVDSMILYKDRNWKHRLSLFNQQSPDLYLTR